MLHLMELKDERARATIAQASNWRFPYVTLHLETEFQMIKSERKKKIKNVKIS